MPTLRELQDEWNRLVPIAHNLGIRRGVRILRSCHETVAIGTRRVEWLRGRIDSAQGRRTWASPPLWPPAPPSPISSTPDFSFGAEVEFLLPEGMNRDAMSSLLQSAGIPCQAEVYNHSRRGNWKLVTDGSIRGSNGLSDYVHGSELVSPPLVGSEGFDQMDKALDVLRLNGAKVNRYCGFHVHVGVSRQTVSFFRNVVRMYKLFEPVIDTMVSPSRRASSNSFAMPMQVYEHRLANATTIEDVARACSQDYTRENARSGRRYRKLNLQSYWQHGTIEFRQHQGTVEAKKARMWTQFCLALSQRAARDWDGFANPSFNDLMNLVEADSQIRDYLTQRIEFLSQARLAA